MRLLLPHVISPASALTSPIPFRYDNLMVAAANGATLVIEELFKFVPASERAKMLRYVARDENSKVVSLYRTHVHAFRLQTRENMFVQ